MDFAGKAGSTMGLDPAVSGIVPDDTEISIEGILNSVEYPGMAIDYWEPSPLCLCLFVT